MFNLQYTGCYHALDGINEWLIRSFCCWIFLEYVIFRRVFQDENALIFFLLLYIYFAKLLFTIPEVGRFCLLLIFVSLGTNNHSVKIDSLRRFFLCIKLEPSCSNLFIGLNKYSMGRKGGRNRPRNRKAHMVKFLLRSYYCHEQMLFELLWPQQFCGDKLNSLRNWGFYVNNFTAGFIWTLNRDTRCFGIPVLRVWSRFEHCWHWSQSNPYSRKAVSVLLKFRRKLTKGDWWVGLPRYPHNKLLGQFFATRKYRGTRWVKFLRPDTGCLYATGHPI